MVNLIRKDLVLQLAFFVFISLNSSCQHTDSKDKIIQDKNNCFDDNINTLKSSRLYLEVMAAFKDTFQILKTRKEYFGVPEIVSCKIDEAIFFKKDSSECMLIVLKRNQFNLVFGTARMIRGGKKDTKWSFEVSMEFSFAKDYFDLFKDNSFENISKIARYSVLTDGNYKRKGCEVDDYYWFIELKK